MSAALLALFGVVGGCAGAAASSGSLVSQPLGHMVPHFSLVEIKGVLKPQVSCFAAVCYCNVPSACLLLVSQQIPVRSLVAGYK